MSYCPKCNTEYELIKNQYDIRQLDIDVAMMSTRQTEARLRRTKAMEETQRLAREKIDVGVQRLRDEDTSMQTIGLRDIIVRSAGSAGTASTGDAPDASVDLQATMRARIEKTSEDVKDDTTVLKRKRQNEVRVRTKGHDMIKGIRN